MCELKTENREMGISISPPLALACAITSAIESGAAFLIPWAPMKIFSMLLTLLLGLSLASSADKYAKDAKEPTGKLLHVVSFKFKDSATTEQIKEVEEAFRGLKKKIKEIKGFEWGTNVSPEKHDKGFTHGFILSF